MVGPNYYTVMRTLFAVSDVVRNSLQDGNLLVIPHAHWSMLWDERLFLMTP